MDLPTIQKCLTPQSPEDVSGWAPGHAWLAGGTWLFSEPQPTLDTLVDMQGFAWVPLQVTPDGGLEIAATCTIETLYIIAANAPKEWQGAALIRPCCEALQSSFKIWHEATVGGNVCLSLPAGALIALMVALEGECELWARTGAKRRLRVLDFVHGERQNALQPGELMRSLHVPASALHKRSAFRRHSLTQEGRSTALLIGTRCPESGAVLLTITAATTRPVQFLLGSEYLKSPAKIEAHLEHAVPATLYFDDAHGTAGYRKHLTHHLAQEILRDLA